MNILEQNIELLLQSSMHYCEEINMEKEIYEMSGNILSDGKRRFLIYNDKELDYVKQSVSDKNALYFYIGMSCVPALVYMFEHMTEGSKMIVIEKNKNIFVQALNEPALTPLITSGKVSFIIADATQSLNLIYSSLISTAVFLSANTVIYFEEYYYYYEREWTKDFSKDILAVIRSVVLVLGNDIEDTLIGIKNIVENTEEILDSCTPHSISLTEQYKNKPAIIVAAGPSLNKQLPLLKKMQGKALILCSDTALTLLLEHDITPDAVTTSERVEIIFDMFYDPLPYQEKIVFIGLPFSDPRIFEKFKHRIICYRKKDSICEWADQVYNASSVFDIGISCTHVGFGLATYLGCSPIMLIGQDLAYGNDGVTHASGTRHEVFDEVPKRNLEQDIKIKGYYGDEVYTEKWWDQFRVWYEQMIASRSLKVYNCTEGGAYIEGASHIPFMEAYEEIKDTQIPALSEICNQVGTYGNAQFLKKALIKDFEFKKSDMKDIQELATIAVKKLDDILLADVGRVETYRNDELEEIIGVLHDCDKKYQEMRTKQWFMHFFQGHLSRLFYEMSLVKPEFCQESVLENVRIQHRFYYFVHTATQVIIGTFLDCMEVVHLEDEENHLCTKEI